jgi:parallel beta-helix repeat protein
MKKNYKVNSLYTMGIVCATLSLAFILCSSPIQSQLLPTMHSRSSSLYSIGDIIYVDDDNTQGPWEGTLDHPYQFIQEGIDHAHDGDTVFVFNGTYVENLVINKQLYLLGEAQESTVIDGSNDGKVVSITSSRATVEEVTIQNSGYFFQDAGIYIRTYYVTVTNTIFRDNTEGIHLWEAKYNTIIGNTFINSEYGIYLDHADSNEIKNNFITNNLQGILLEESSNNDIHGNIITDNKDGVTCMSYCNMNTIVNNHFEGNDHWGLFFDRLFDKQNHVYHNNFIENNINAYFETTLLNTWDYNYWDDWIGIKYSPYQFLPKAIVGRIFGPIPWLNLDLHPAKEPFTIDTQ